MANGDALEFEGVIESFAKDRFTVKVNDNYSPLCTLSGKIRQSGIRLTLGDRVKIEVSPYNLQLGRIVFRMK